MGTASVLLKRQECLGCQGLRLLEEKAVRSLEKGRAARAEVHLRPPEGLRFSGIGGAASLQGSGPL